MSDDKARRGVVSRRAVLQLGALSGAALTLAPMTFARAAAGSAVKTIEGHLDTGAADFVYLPVEVPDGVQQIDVSYSYDKPAVPPGVLANSCDIGVFDQRGTALGGRGFRGWSGGFRTSFSSTRRPRRRATCRGRSGPAPGTSCSGLTRSPRKAWTIRCRSA